MKEDLISIIRFLIFLTIFSLVMYFVIKYDRTTKETTCPTTSAFATQKEIQVEPSSLPKLYPSQIYIVNGDLNGDGKDDPIIFSPGETVQLPTKEWKIYVVTFTRVPTDCDKQDALSTLRLRIMLLP